MDIKGREEIINDCFDKLYSLLNSLQNTSQKVKAFDVSSSYKVIEELQRQTKELLLFLKINPKPVTPLSSLHPDNLVGWKLKGEGNFGKVYECHLYGSRVAVKVLKDHSKSLSAIPESFLLKELRHDNVVAFRGMGFVTHSRIENIAGTNATTQPHLNAKCSAKKECSENAGIKVQSEKNMHDYNYIDKMEITQTVLSDSGSGYIDEVALHKTSSLTSYQIVPDVTTSSDRTCSSVKRRRVNQISTKPSEKSKPEQESRLCNLHGAYLSNDAEYTHFQSDEYVYSQEQMHYAADETGLHRSSGVLMFIVMEYIDLNLLSYVQERRNTQGLSYSETWNITSQVVKAIAYLHSNNIVHRDLKPDNILVKVGPGNIQVKVADFGLAWGNESNYLKAECKQNYLWKSGEKQRSYVHVRWGAPEFIFGKRNPTLTDYKYGDMYSLGLVIYFALTGEKALAELSTQQLVSRVQRRNLHQIMYSQSQNDLYDTRGIVTLPEDLSGPLLDIIKSCLQKRPTDRSLAEELLLQYFTCSENPYANDPLKAEFFSVGFLTTSVFVADSVYSETLGFYRTGNRPTGYDHSDLICLVETKDAPYNDLPVSWDENQISVYAQTKTKYEKMVEQREIDNNPLAGLKDIKITRPGKEEKQTIKLHFKESVYVHHRTMREIWASFTDENRDRIIPCKSDVDPFFSNSFGLHVAVLTNEGHNEPQKLVFPRRSRRSPMASPGVFTCGAVESVSCPDYRQSGDQWYVDLVRTASRGLLEELGLELTGRDVDAICLNTVYVKFDFYEWGLCGFVDLKDERIANEHRLSASDLTKRFTSGPKDKYEHQTITFVDFQLEPIMNFISENHNEFASSTKLVVVKVLEAFFGHDVVSRAFGEMEVT